MTPEQIKALAAPDIDAYTVKQKIEYAGLTWIIKFEQDNDVGAPWDFSDYHGPVRRSGYRHSMYGEREKKKPSERPLNNPDRNGYQFYYDWQAAIKKAKAEGWGTNEAPGDYLAAVEADFEYLRGWIRGDWSYMWVQVQCVEHPHFEDSCGGLESLNDNHAEFAFSELLRPLAIQAHAETRDAEYWANRDVITEAA